MNENSSRGFWQTLPLYLACYALWIAFSALALLAIPPLLLNLTRLGELLGLSRWALSAISKFGIYLLGMLWLIAIILLESYLRRGVEMRKLWSRTRQVILIELVILAFSFGLRSLLA